MFIYILFIYEGCDGFNIPQILSSEKRKGEPLQTRLFADSVGLSVLKSVLTYQQQIFPFIINPIMILHREQ